MIREELLIDEICKLIKYDKSEMSEDKSSFNIFSILRNENEEVMLHSRFIYELLNPKGTHLMNAKYLTHFLNVLKNIGQIPLPDFFDDQLFETTVYRERFNIDILVYLPDGYTLIIENKIDAIDQDSQLERYYKTIVNQCRRAGEKTFIVYLTLDGREPTAQSIGKLKTDIYQISYASEVDHWLEMCCKESVRYTNLHETILQYKQLICRLTGKFDDKEGNRMDQIADIILKSKDSLESAININNALNIAKSRVISRLFQELESEMTKAGYKKNSSSEMEIESIANYYISKEIIWQRYVLKSDLNDIDFCFAFEITDRLYYYFAFTTKEACEIIEKEDIENFDQPMYAKYLNAICKAHNVENIKRTTSGSLMWDYIYDDSGRLYDFKRFSKSCTDLFDDIEGEARRICNDLIPMIRLVESELG